MNWPMENFTRILKRASLLVLDKMHLVKLRHFISLYTTTFTTQKICYLISHVIRFHENKIYFQQSKNSSFTKNAIFYHFLPTFSLLYYYYFFTKFILHVLFFIINNFQYEYKGTKVKQRFVSSFEYHNCVLYFEYFSRHVYFCTFLYVQVCKLCGLL